MRHNINNINNMVKYWRAGTHQRVPSNSAPNPGAGADHAPITGADHVQTAHTPDDSAETAGVRGHNHHTHTMILAPEHDDEGDEQRQLPLADIYDTISVGAYLRLPAGMRPRLDRRVAGSVPGDAAALRSDTLRPPIYADVAVNEDYTHSWAETGNDSNSNSTARDVAAAHVPVTITPHSGLRTCTHTHDHGHDHDHCTAEDLTLLRNTGFSDETSTCWEAHVENLPAHRLAPGLEVNGAGTSDIVAKALVRVARCSGRDAVERVRHEHYVHTRLAAHDTHPNVVRFLGGCTHNETPFLVHARPSSTSLGDLVQQHSDTRDTPLTLEKRATLALDAAAALKFMHSKGVALGYTDTQGFAVSPQGQAQAYNMSGATLVDNSQYGFARARRAARAARAARGTPPPPSINTNAKARDVWYFGFVLWEIATGSMPAPFEPTRAERPPRPYDMPSVLYDLAARCWSTSAVASGNQTLTADGLHTALAHILESEDSLSLCGYNVDLFDAEGCSVDITDLQCGVCREVMRDPVTVSCGHSFCSYCITEWVTYRHQRSCPCCRASISSESMHPAIALKNVIAKLPLKANMSPGEADAQITELESEPESAQEASVAVQDSSQPTPPQPPQTHSLHAPIISAPIMSAPITPTTPQPPHSQQSRPLDESLQTLAQRSAHNSGAPPLSEDTGEDSCEEYDGYSDQEDYHDVVERPHDYMPAPCSSSDCQLDHVDQAHALHAVPQSLDVRLRFPKAVMMENEYCRQWQQGLAQGIFGPATVDAANAAMALDSAAATATCRIDTASSDALCMIAGELTKRMAREQRQPLATKLRKERASIKGNNSVLRSVHLERQSRLSIRKSMRDYTMQRTIQEPDHDLRERCQSTTSSLRLLAAHLARSQRFARRDRPPHNNQHPSGEAQYARQTTPPTPLQTPQHFGAAAAPHRGKICMTRFTNTAHGNESLPLAPGSFRTDTSDASVDSFPEGQWDPTDLDLLELHCPPTQPLDGMRNNNDTISHPHECMHAHTL